MTRRNYMRRLSFKANMLCGSQEPEDNISLAYIDGKLPPHYPVPAIPTEIERTRNGVTIYQPYARSPWLWCPVVSIIKGVMTGQWHIHRGNRELM